MWDMTTTMRNRVQPGKTSCLLILVVALLLGACRSETELRPFTSDGCSLFPDASVISGENWCSCCFVHDIAYWKGGTEAEREAADRALQACVVEKTDDEAFGRLMYNGVRAGGSPYFYNWYRWGYGYGYERKYQESTPEEIARADVLLAEYFANDATPVCSD
jgi:hypothetical protein